MADRQQYNMATIKLRNITDNVLEIAGLDLEPNEVEVLTPQEHEEFRVDEEIMEAVANRSLQIETDEKVFESATDGWAYMTGDTLPKSKIEGDKLAVHTSYKPEIPGGTTYAIWAGAGDDLSDPENGNGKGPVLSLQTKIDELETSIDVEFNPLYGRTWLHEAYLKFTGAGLGDSISSTIMSYPVPVQDQIHKDLLLDSDGWISYSPLGPGSGTHGFADPNRIQLVDRSYSNDGDWDFIQGSLVPNFYKKGRFKMSTKEQIVHRYVNRVPCYGDCGTYFSMSSDETSELLKGYFVRITLNNASNTVWHASVLMEMYRESTY